MVAICVLALVGASCSAQGNEPELDGLTTFREAGCAACHGQNAEGGSAPGMGGHRAEQIVRQVRAPLGAMPLFRVAELSDAELDPVDHSGAHGHGDTTALDPRDVLAGHHWMALSSMLVGDIGEAVHHIGDITDVVTGEHLVMMDDIVALLEAGDIDAAREMTMVMLAGFVPEVGAIDELHLRLALQAMAVDHLKRVGAGAFADAAQEALGAVDAGDMHDATELLLVVLGGAVHDD